MSIIAIDSACGPDGFTEGWALATGQRDNIIGFDFNATARATYDAEGSKAYHADLFDTDDYVRRVLEATGGDRPQVVIGSSSCKGWTPLGQRKGADDNRDTLLPWLSATGQLKPEVAIMENVKQAASHPDWMKGLKAINMPLVAIWTLRANHYGAPTKRERTFWIWRKDGKWPLLPATNPVELKYASVVSNSGGQFGIRRLEENTYLYSRVSAAADAKMQERWTILTVEEALEAQGCPGKTICGNPRERAQQIADMIPPPLAAAVIKAALKGAGALGETVNFALSRQTEDTSTLHHRLSGIGEEV